MGGDFCCAVGCHNNRGANQDVTFHVFPRDLQRRARWIAAVRRAHWVPTKASRLCSVHFTEESYELSSRLSKEFGLGQRAPRLNADAVPTIFNYVVAPSTPLRGAFAKRRRKDTVDEAIVEHAAMAAANSVPDPNPDPIPVGNGDLVPDGGQFSMDVSGPEVEPTPRNACVFIQTDPVQTCTQSNQTKIKVRSIGTQTAFPKPSKEVQTETTQQTNSATSNPVLVDAPTDDAHGSDSDDDPLGLLLQDPRDTDYHPNSSEDEEAPGTGATPEANQAAADKYIVFGSCLKKLLKRCPHCFSMSTQVSFQLVGSMVKATITCSAGHTSSWESQPRCHGKPEGNILMCSGIVFSGGCPTKVLRLFDIMGVARIHSTQFNEYQRCYLLPAVMDVWRAEQHTLVESLQGRPLRLAGDGRSDSPGFSALHGTYSLLETSINRIIHLELVQSTEVKSSCHMELEGLTRSLLYFAELGITVEVLVTDRHLQVSAYMKREHPLIQHRFDIWHVSKGIKKIVAFAKSPRHKPLEKWLDTITKHLYWCARTSNGQGDLILAKWTSITRHICDVHHHPNPLHPACLHGDVSDRLWIEEGTETYKKLESVVLSKHLLRDIPKLSSDEQTFGLEAFHGVLIHFASKSVGYRYDGLLARTYIAALHYNCNADRKVRLAEDGRDKHALKFSRARKQWTIVPVMEDTKFGYIQKLLTGLFE
ncbi:unnamed protein product, partial [Ixodes hexagonus]